MSGLGTSNLSRGQADISSLNVGSSSSSKKDVRGSAVKVAEKKSGFDAELLPPSKSGKLSTSIIPADEMKSPVPFTPESEVGLINSTDDLSGPAFSTTSLYGEDEHDHDPEFSDFDQEDQIERRKKRSAIGTPDYLAPEILLGTGHGASANWWSVGIILFELIVGIPPFSAEHPQMIFDNILNRKIPWPRVPEEISAEAADLIDKLWTEDPYQRLGANGASEVKQHIFFKDINWDTLKRQKALFVPTYDSAFDTSYFTSRNSWNLSNPNMSEGYELEMSSDDGSVSGSSSCVSNCQDNAADECPAEFDSNTSVDYLFSSFSFKNLSQVASINYEFARKGSGSGSGSEEGPSNQT